MAREMTVEEARAHCGGSLKAVPADVAEWIRDNLPRYLWVWDDPEDRRERVLICEQCGTRRTERKTGGRWPESLPQGTERPAPCCGGRATVKHLGRGYTGLRDRLEAVWYTKSAADPAAVVAFGAFAERDFSCAGEDPWHVEPEIDVRSVSVIVPGRGGFRFKEKVTRWENAGYRWVPARLEWVPVKRPGPLTFGDAAGNYSGAFRPARPPRVLLSDSLEAAVEGTPLARAWRPEYLLAERGLDGTEALALIAKYPCIEYMTKLGMVELLPARLLGEMPANLVNWRGKSITNVLKLGRPRLGEYKAAGIPITPEILLTEQWLAGTKYRLTAPAAASVACLARRWTGTGRIGEAVEGALEVFQPSRRQKALKYMARQAEKYGNSRMHLGDFKDYWRGCRRWHEDLNDDAVAFPADVRAAEARHIEMDRRERDDRERMKDADRDVLIGKRWAKLEKRFGFSFGGLTLRPARDCAEVRREGRCLHHCVGGYVSRYAEGGTVICVLRRDCDPDMPWRTVELTKEGRLVQDRGYRNDVAGVGIPMSKSYRAALNCFWEAWGEQMNQRRGA